VTIWVDGAAVVAYPGETVATAILASGRRAFRVTARRGELRGPFCNMGACFECLITVDGATDVRACMTLVRAGMRILTEVPGAGD